MLLNSFSSHYTPNANGIRNNNSNVNTDNNSKNTVNSNQQLNRRANSNPLSRLLGGGCSCGCQNHDDDDPCCPNRGISLSTILFFVLIFLLLFYND